MARQGTGQRIAKQSPNTIEKHCFMRQTGLYYYGANMPLKPKFDMKNNISIGLKITGITMKKATILFILFFTPFCLLKAQMSNEEICDIYSQIIYDLKEQVKNDYRQKGLYVANQIQILKDFPRYINLAKGLFSNELDKWMIDYSNITNMTDSFDLTSCFDNRIKVINAGDYYTKFNRNPRRYANKIRKGICLFSNIGYSDEFAFVEVIVQLSYSRRYSNFYFFKKVENWDLIYFREGCD